MFTALLQKCIEKGVFAVCRYTSRRNTPPCFVALVPQKEQVDEGQVQMTPPGNLGQRLGGVSDAYNASQFSIMEYNVITLSSCMFAHVCARAPGFNAIFLPFAEDVRSLDIPQNPTASHTQVEKMKEIVHKLHFRYRCSLQICSLLTTSLSGI